MTWRERDHPRWPRGAPGGRGGEFRGELGGDWADAASARMLPSLRGMMERYGHIPRRDTIRGPGDPPWGRSVENDPVLDQEAGHHEQLTAAAKRLLEGVTSRDGELRVEGVSAQQMGGDRTWPRFVNPATGEVEDTLEGLGPQHMSLGHVNIEGAVVGPRGEDRGRIRLSAHLNDGPGEDGKWEIHVDRFYAHLDEQEAQGRASFGDGDQGLRPGHGGGLATEVLRRVADWGRESGFDRMTIGPSDTGFYAWAALGFDFDGLESRRVAVEGLLAMSPADLQRFGLSRAAAVRGAARLKLAAAEVLAGTMSAHRLSQLGRREGQGRDDMWLGKAAILFSGWGGGIYDLSRTRGRL